LLQWAREERKDINIHAHTTNAVNKRDVDFGVESLFVEFQNGAWVIPCDMNGKCDPEVQAFIDECLYYQPPPAHTGDRLMSAWIASEGARNSSGDRPPPSVGKPRQLTWNNTGGF
jgi:hypothetical protein